MLEIAVKCMKHARQPSEAVLCKIYLIILFTCFMSERCLYGGGPALLVGLVLFAEISRLS